MKTVLIRPFSTERMIPIIAELRKRERRSGIFMSQVWAAKNLLYFTNFQQQYVEIGINNGEKFGHYDETNWVARDVEVYLYFEIYGNEIEINPIKLRQQIYYRIIKNKRNWLASGDPILWDTAR